VVKLDLGVHVDGYIADTALTVEITSNRWSQLISASNEALEMVLEAMSPGIAAGVIGGTIERVVRSKGLVPVANLTGHSLERYNLHAGVSVPNVADGSTAQILPGMAVAIEPFATNGAGRVAGRKSGNIYKLLRLKEMDDPDLDSLLKGMHDEFRYLPFPERWVARNTPRPEKAIKRLLRAGAIATYPILSEVKNGMVSQFEHTVVMTGKGPVVTTR
jgi:methionyl aminopeptidase